LAFLFKKCINVISLRLHSGQALARFSYRLFVSPLTSFGRNDNNEDCRAALAMTAILNRPFDCAQGDDFVLRIAYVVLRTEGMTLFK